MKSLADQLKDRGHYVVSYLMFCVSDDISLPYRSAVMIENNITMVRDALQKNQNVVFTSWEHDEFLQYKDANFVGFEKILGPYYNTNRWAVSVPTFGHNTYDPRQVSNLDFLVYVNRFNKEYSSIKLNHSHKTKDFLYLNGKPHPHRVKLLNTLLKTTILDNSLWSASCSSQGWGDKEKKLDEKYELPEWRGLAVDGYDDSTRRVHYPQYNTTICSLIPETLATNDFHYITEKTCKPLMAEHLFVVLAGRGYLRNMRSLGFRTFHDFFDESYDECDDIDVRISKIVSTLEQIKKIDPLSLYNETKDIRKHNRELFFDDKFYEEFNTSQVKTLESFFAKKDVQVRMDL